MTTESTEPAVDSRPLPKLHLQLMTKNLASTYWEQFWRGLIDLGDEIDTVITGSIFVLDTGSTDNTLAMLSQLPPKLRDRIFVTQHEWEDDFAFMRNLVHNAMVEQCGDDAVIWLDSDDVVSVKTWQAVRDSFTSAWEKLPEALEANPDVDCNRIEIMLPYNYSYDTNGNVTVRQHRERVMWPIKDFTWKGTLHELLLRVDPDVKVCSTRIEGNSVDAAAVEHRQKPEVRESRRNWRIALSAWLSTDTSSWRELMYSMAEAELHNLEAAIAIAGITGMLSAKGYRTRLTRFGFFSAPFKELPQTISQHAMAATDCAIQASNIVIKNAEFLAREAAESGKAVPQSVRKMLLDIVEVLELAAHLESMAVDAPVRADFELKVGEVLNMVIELFGDDEQRTIGKNLLERMYTLYDFVPAYATGSIRSDFVLGGLPRAIVTRYHLTVGELDAAFREHIESLRSPIPCQQVYYNDQRLRFFISKLRPRIVMLPKMSNEDALAKTAEIKQVLDCYLSELRTRPVWVIDHCASRGLEYAFTSEDAYVCAFADGLLAREKQSREKLLELFDVWDPAVANMVFIQERRESVGFSVNVVPRERILWLMHPCHHGISRSFDAPEFSFAEKWRGVLFDAEFCASKYMNRRMCQLEQDPNNTDTRKHAMFAFCDPSVAIMAPASLEPWDADTVWKTGIGGSESCAAFLGMELCRHVKRLTVFAHTPNEARSAYRAFDGGGPAEFMPVEMFPHLANSYDVIIYSRIWPEKRLAKCQIVWLHDMPGNMPASYNSRSIDYVVVLSEFHKAEFCAKFPELASRTVVISHGVGMRPLDYGLNQFEGGFRMLFTPQPERGLDEFCLLTQLARMEIGNRDKEEEGWKLQSACIYGTYNYTASFKGSYEGELRIWQWANACERAGVQRLGRRSRGEVAHLLRMADVMAYPSSGFKETFCLSVLEAAAMGTPVLVSEHAGAASEVLRKHAPTRLFRVLKSAGPSEDRNEWVDALMEIYEQRKEIRRQKAAVEVAQRNAKAVADSGYLHAENSSAPLSWRQVCYQNGGWFDLMYETLSNRRG